MKTKSIGEILGEEREFHRLSLADLAKRTRIRLEYLQALENNEFDKLPSSTFVKGYIRTYGQIFGFDYLPLLALLRRDFKESAKGKLVPREFIKPVLKKRPFWTPITAAMVVLGTLFLTLITYVLVQWYHFTKPPLLEVFSPEADAFVSAQVMVEGRTNPEAVVAVNAQPVSLQPDGSFRYELYLPREGITTITVEATDRRGKTNLLQRTVYVKF
ncbi:MAG TPA: helix-turn-helix domain-containing protein [Vitreimonas sp.]|nr:helix-turn-helix domain-containing protein [Vitreimonas sp.]